MNSVQHITGKWLKRALRDIHKQLTIWMDDDPHPNSTYSQLNRLHRSFLRAEPGLRSSYAWGAIHGVHLAHVLGFESASLLEFGVAGGRGILALERIASMLEDVWPVKIEIYGFDSGVGLPRVTDHRDLPNLWAEDGWFPMDRPKLESRLKRTKLLIDDVRDSVPKFLSQRHAPVAFMSIDLDLYSSTVEALKVLDGDTSLLLPRVHCYFDDMIGFTFGDGNGERLAIAEFNAARARRNVSPIYGLKRFAPVEERQQPWVEQMYMAHIGDHPLYARFDQLLRGSGRLDIPG